MVDIMYSVDMVRLKTRVPKEYIDRFVKRKLDTNPGIKYWSNFGIKQYRHNWQIRENHPLNEKYTTPHEKLYSAGEYSYWLGYDHNSETDKINADLVIEFNPNKCPVDGLLEYVLMEFYASVETTVVSVDIAMDFEVNISNLLVDKFRKKKMKIIYGGQGEDDLTYYIGEGDGRIKIYNKARELGIEGDLTRYEVTKKISKKIKELVRPDYGFEANIIPIGYLTSLPTDKTLSGLLWAVKNGYQMDRLTRHQRDKIREYIMNNTELKIDDKKISQVIQTYFRGYKQILQIR